MATAKEKKLQTDPKCIILRAASVIMIFLSLTRGGLAGVKLGAVHSSDLPGADHEILRTVKVILASDDGGRSSKPDHVMEADLVRLYDPYHWILNSSSNYSNGAVVVGLSEADAGKMASSRERAAQWIEQTVLPYASKMNIRAIIVGDLGGGNFSTNSSNVIFSHSISVTVLVECMHHIRDALVQFHLEQQIKVCTSVLPSTSVITLPCLPSPPNSRLKNASNHTTSFIWPLLDSLSSTGSYLMLTIRLNPLEADAAATTYQQTQAPRRDVLYSTFQALEGCIDFAELLFAMLKNLNAGRWWNELQKLHITPLQKLDQALHSASDSSRSASKRRQLLSGKRSSRVLSMHDSRLNAHWSSNNNSNTGQSWCIAKPATPDSQLSTALNWVCASPIVDCRSIQQNGSCFYPNTYVSHCAYAFNLYYQNSGRESGSCNFGGTAIVVATDPSYAGCSYPSSSSRTSGIIPSPGPNGSSTGGTNYSTGSSPMGSFPGGNGSNSPYNSATKLFFRKRFIRTSALLVLFHLIVSSSKAAV